MSAESLQVGVVVFTPTSSHARHDPESLARVLNAFFAEHGITEGDVLDIAHSQDRAASAAAAGGPDVTRQFVTVFLKGRPNLTQTVRYDLR